MTEKIIHVSVPLLISDVQRLKQMTGCEETKAAVTAAIFFRIAAGKIKKED